MGAGRRRTGCPGRRGGVPADRPRRARPASAAPAGARTGARRRHPARSGGPARAAGGRAAGHGRPRRPGPAGGRAAGLPRRRPARLRHLHVGLDRRSQGRDDRAPLGGQHDPGHRPAVGDGEGRPGAGPLRPLLRPLRVRRLRHAGRGGGRGPPAGGLRPRPAGVVRADQEAPGDGVELRAGAGGDAGRVRRRRAGAPGVVPAAGAAQRRLGGAVAARPGASARTRRAGGQPGRHDRDRDLVHPPGRGPGGSRVAQHPVRPAAGGPVHRGAGRRAGAVPRPGPRPALHRRAGSGTRLLARAGPDGRELPPRSRHR